MHSPARSPAVEWVIGFFSSDRVDSRCFVIAEDEGLGPSQPHYCRGCRGGSLPLLVVRLEPGRPFQSGRSFQRCRLFDCNKAIHREIRWLANGRHVQTDVKFGPEEQEFKIYPKCESYGSIKAASYHVRCHFFCLLSSQCQVALFILGSKQYYCILKHLCVCATAVSTWFPP